MCNVWCYRAVCPLGYCFRWEQSFLYCVLQDRTWKLLKFESVMPFVFVYFDFCGIILAGYCLSFCVLFCKALPIVNLVHGSSVRQAVSSSMCCNVLPTLEVFLYSGSYLLVTKQEALWTLSMHRCNTHGQCYHVLLLKWIQNIGTCML